MREGKIVIELVPSAFDLMLHALIDPNQILNIAKGDSFQMCLSTRDTSHVFNLFGHVQRISADLKRGSESDNTFIWRGS